MDFPPQHSATDDNDYEMEEKFRIAKIAFLPIYFSFSRFVQHKQLAPGILRRVYLSKRNKSKWIPFRLRSVCLFLESICGWVRKLCRVVGESFTFTLKDKINTFLDPKSS